MSNLSKTIEKAKLYLEQVRSTKKEMKARYGQDYYTLDFAGKQERRKKIDSKSSISSTTPSLPKEELYRVQLVSNTGDYWKARKTIGLDSDGSGTGFGKWDLEWYDLTLTQARNKVKSLEKTKYGKNANITISKMSDYD